MRGKKAVGIILVCLMLVISMLFVNATQFTEDTNNPIYGAHLGDGKAYYPSVVYDSNQFSGHGNTSYYKMWYDPGDGTPRLLLSDDGTDFGSFSDSIAMTNLSTAYHPSVIYNSDGIDGTGYYYRMYYWDGSTDLSTRVAESTDGINWENDQLITQNTTYHLQETDDGFWHQHYGPGNVYYNSSATDSGSNPWNYTFTMTFDTSSANILEPTYGYEHTGLAYSSDGFNWTRYGDEPILTADNDSEWDAHYSYHGDIIKVKENDWRMWYSGGDDDEDGGKYYAEGVGEAYSTDGLTWYKSDDNPILHFSDNQSDSSLDWRGYRTYTPNVIRNGTYIMMYYTGDDGDNRSIGYADAFLTETEVEIIVSPSVIEVGDTFNFTEFINQDVSIQACKFTVNFTTNMNVTNGWVGEDPLWDDTFFTLGTIYNDTGDGTGSVNYTQNGITHTTENGSLAVFNATAMSVGPCYINHTYVKIGSSDHGDWYIEDVVTIDAAFTIYPHSPSGLTATMTTDTRIDLSGFSPGDGGTHTVIRRATGSYPATPQAGTEVYNGTGSSTSDTSLTANTTYYYRAWTYNTTQNVFSYNYQQDTEKTNEYPINDNPSPADGAENVELNPDLSIDVYDYDGQDMDVSFYTNASGSWVLIGSNMSVSDGTYQQSTSQFDLWETDYWWSVNTTDGINWKNNTYTFETLPNEPATAENPTPHQVNKVNISPVCEVDILDKERSTSIIVTWQENTTGSWVTRSVNTSVGDNETVSWVFAEADTMDTDYWWRVYVDDGINNVSYGPWNFTTLFLNVSNEYPLNNDAEVEREANLSADCDGYGMDVYIYFYNMTPKVHTWSLVDSWTEENSDRFETNREYGNDFKWGNTTYTWSVNITDGTNWVNKTYTYVTEQQTAEGHNARMDVDADNTLDIFDARDTYNNYNQGHEFDGIYDVDENDDIDVFDCRTIYNEYN